MSQTSTSRDEIFQRIATERRRLKKNIAALEESELVEPGVVGEWSVKDILFHLAAWETRLNGWLVAHARNEPPDDPRPGESLDIHGFNKEVFDRNKHLSLEEAFSRFESCHEDTLAALDGLPEDDLRKPVEFEWATGEWWQLIASNTYNHYRWAKRHIRKWARDMDLM